MEQLKRLCDKKGIDRILYFVTEKEKNSTVTKQGLLLVQSIIKILDLNYIVILMLQ